MAGDNPWDTYVRRWTQSPETVFIEDRAATGDRATYLTTIGDEWGTKASVESVVAEFLLPFIGSDAVVLDLGCGGGRVARHLRPYVRTLVCADPSMAMLEVAGRLVPALKSSRVHTADTPTALPFGRAAFDLIFSFDVMVHFESRLIYRYMLACADLLRDGGRLMVHVATADTPVGLEHFRRSAVAGGSATAFGAFSYQSRTLVDAMGRMAGLCPLLCSLPLAGHFYCQRDFVAVFEKRLTPTAPQG